MCYCPDDNGRPEFYDVTYPRSRKARACVECDAEILPGIRYARHTQKWEGEVRSTSFCVDCDAWASALSSAQIKACGCSGWLYGGLWDAVAEFTDEHLGYDHETGQPRKIYVDPAVEAYNRRLRSSVDSAGPSI
jgi:hypothetical protein